MATKPDNGEEKKVYYDPVYSPRRLQKNNNNNGEGRKLFDDFSLANHVHISRPQMVSVNTSSLLQKQNNELKVKGENLKK